MITVRLILTLQYLYVNRYILIVQSFETKKLNVFSTYIFEAFETRLNASESKLDELKKNNSGKEF